jgi:hypothetical protein
MKIWASHNGGRLSDELFPVIHHFRELMVAKINGEARGN